jgi:hypothetical protein
MTKQPNVSDILEYASRFRKLSFTDQGELAYQIAEHFGERIEP